MILFLTLAGTFAFGLSGGLAAVRARLDLFGVVVLAGVVALAGGITRDVLIGVPPATFRDWRYLATAGAAGAVCFLAHPTLDRLALAVQLADAFGLALSCVTGAATAVANGLGPLQAGLLGAVTGVGGGILRDILLAEVPVVLRREFYAVPALTGAGVYAVADLLGIRGGPAAITGAAVCLVMRLVGIRYQVTIPVARPRSASATTDATDAAPPDPSGS